MIRRINDAFFDELAQKASQSPRKRSHHNFHKQHGEPVQRLCIALDRGTYVRPHKHPEANKWELMLVLRGAVELLIFSRSGEVLSRLHLSSDGPERGVEIRNNTWHTVFPLEDGSVIIEAKEGPYAPVSPDSFAHWAPEEGSDEVAAFLEWAGRAKPGDRYRKTA
ncbi:MAG: WbuC family cupin fold metalloprotein [Nitrospirota bacterium]|nr:WbuC family cupin fold metalloprotein [Nitrospirota bacterium]